MSSTGSKSQCLIMFSGGLLLRRGFKGDADVERLLKKTVRY